MRTLRYVAPRALVIAHADPNPPAEGEVQIAVAFTGLCGTDLHIFHGDMDARVKTPLVFGHEMSGVIAETGPGTMPWSVGDHVTVMPLVWDGVCPACRAGNEHVCQNLEFIGIDSPGAMQERWNVPASSLVRIPADMALDIAALVEPVAVAVHDVERSELKAGDRAVVIGGGPIGVLIATVARHAGASVVVIEVDDRRRAQIANLGFATIDPLTVDQAAWVETWTAGAGADIVFEVSGAPAAVAGATALAKVRGTIVVVAIHPRPRDVDLQRVFWRELRILGARVYRRENFERAVELLAEGVIPTATLITHVVSLDKTEQAFSDLEAGRALKILVSLGGE